jgi:hypothetical protein
MKKKILVIADLGHASPRIPGIFSELSKFGWEVHVYSPQMSKNQKNILGLSRLRNLKLIESNSKMWYKRDYSEKFLKRTGIKIRRKLVNSQLAELLKQMIFQNKYKYVELDHLVWVKKSCKELNQIIAHNKYKFVFSSSSPIASHIIAKKVSKQYNIKWIADLRDLWSFNHTNTIEVSNETIQFEKKLFSTAQQLITVSKQFAGIQSKLYKGNIEVVYNGFTSINKSNTRKSKNKISIVYTGVLEVGFHDYEILLDKIHKIDQITNCKIQFVFAGSCCSIVSDYFEKQNKIIPESVMLMGNLPRVSAHKLQNDADALLLFGWKDRKTTGLLQTKFFEYLSTKKPILLLGGSGDLEARSILKETNTGFYFQNIEQFIGKLHYLSMNGRISISPINKEIKTYSYNSQARKLNSVLARVGK